MEVAEIKPILKANKATLIFSAQREAIFPCDMDGIRHRRICARTGTSEASVPPATAPLGSSAQPRRTCRLLVPPSAQAAGLRGCAQLDFSLLGEAMRLQSATMG